MIPSYSSESPGRIDFYRTEAFAEIIAAAVTTILNDSLHFRLVSRFARSDPCNRRIAMKPNTAAQLRKEEDRKFRYAAERWRKWIEDLRRRQQRNERDRRRKLLLALLLALLESKPVQAFFPVGFAAQDPARQNRQARPARKLAKNSDLGAEDDQRTDYERIYLSDYSPRFGEEHLEVMDGLTWNDIIALHRQYRPHLFPKFTPVPGMPKRYADEAVHIWTLLDHLQYDFLRNDAIKALKLLVDPGSHEWIDTCANGAQGNSWKNLRYCRGRTPDMTLAEFPRAANRWREEQRREAEERKREIKETPVSGPKPPDLD
jgi:hypothetical protein